MRDLESDIYGLKSNDWYFSLFLIIAYIIISVELVCSFAIIRYITERNSFFISLLRPPFSTIFEVNPAINSAKSRPESSMIGHTLRCHISRLLRLLIGRHFTRPIIISANVAQRRGH